MRHSGPADVLTNAAAVESVRPESRNVSPTDPALTRLWPSMEQHTFGQEKAVRQANLCHDIKRN